MSFHRRLSRQELTTHKNTNDVTNDLASLNFENSLSSEERKYLPLRARYNAFSVTSCAHASYIVGILNEIRQVLSEIKNPINKKTIKFLHHTPPRNPLKVGMIGCGRLGKQLISALLAFSDVRPDEILVSTRRPNSLGFLHKAGIRCIFDNREVVTSSHIVLLCCLPANMPSVADEIAGYISADCLIFSFVTGIGLPRYVYKAFSNRVKEHIDDTNSERKNQSKVPLEYAQNALKINFYFGTSQRLKQMLQHNNVFKIEFTWSMQNATKPWNMGDDVTTTLEKEWIAELTCPLSEQAKKEGVVWSSCKMIEIAMYAAFNMCPSLGVTTKEAIDLINKAFLAKDESEMAGFSWHHFLDDDSLSFVKLGNLPVFDMFHIGTQDTPFTNVLESNEHEALQKIIIKKYMSMFNKYRSIKDG